MKDRRKKAALAVGVLSVVLLAGCMRAPVMPPSGWLYNETEAPLDIDMQETKIGSKRGESSCMSVLGLVAVGDASIEAAARNGGIKTVQHADYRYTNVLFGMYQEYTTIVYGE